MFISKDKFRKDISKYDGLANVCIDCENKRMRSKSGLLRRIYNRQTKSSIDRGHELQSYTLQDLYDRYLESYKFIRLYKNWVKSDYNKNCTPSLDRIDPDKSYTLDNIQIMTWQENNIKGHKENSIRYRNRKENNMSKNLVIVESPTKIKTLEKILGRDYIVMASYGHVRDMPGNNLGFDTKTLNPDYKISKDKVKTVSKIKREIFPGMTIYLASDLDREGEAIAWHLIPALGLNPKKNIIKRITFNEITAKAVKEAIANPREIDINMVDAQQARRVLDRAVGYGLSPLLWKKIRFGLSAGRVQSAATKIIVDRDREIDAFIPDEFWKIKAIFKGPELHSELMKVNNKKVDLKSKQDADRIESSLNQGNYVLKDILKNTSKRNPSIPFTTSTLQQEASIKLGSSVKNTMSNAQALYEGNVGNIPGHDGGLITYMRTDSLNLSEVAISAITGLIKREFSDKYLNDKPRRYKTNSKGAQEAHEAIRPANVNLKPSDIKAYVSNHHYKLYELIWNRTVATQMKPALVDNTTYMIEAGKDKELIFTAKGEVISFDGFLKIYSNASKDKILPKIEKGTVLDIDELLLEQNFTKPPARYTEATLVKKLETEGIGRPSTFASTVGTIQSRNYVITNDDKRLQSTFTGNNVTKFLEDHFEDIVDLKFTAKVEAEFDDIADGKLDWKKCLEAFYRPFEKRLAEKDKSIDKADYVEAIDLGINPKNNKPIIIKIGKSGPYIQNGTKDDDEKPKFSQVPKDVKVDDITLKMALSYLEYPKVLGKLENKDVVINNTLFGVCIIHDKKYYNVGDIPIATIDEKSAIELIKSKREEKIKNLLWHSKDMSCGEVSVINGRFGPYILLHGNKTTKKANLKLPYELKNDIDKIKALTKDELIKIIDNQPKSKSGKMVYKKKK